MTSSPRRDISLDRIYNQPCGTLAEILDNFVDVIVTSPPYNLSYKAQRNKKHNMSGYDGYTDHILQDEYEAGQIQLLNACCRVIKPGGSIFYNHKERQVDGVAISPHRWVLQSQCELVQTIIWDRGSTHNIDPVRLYPTDEYIFHLRKPGCRPRFNPVCAKWSKIWRMTYKETRQIGHPAPFPVELPLRCLKVAGTRPGDLVLDPYVGSGSTALAAIEMGAHWIGYEISATYIDLAMARINKASTEKQLWDPPPAKTAKSVPRDIFAEQVAS